MNNAQKAEVGLLIWAVEIEKARERQEATRLVGRGIQKQDIMVVPSEGTTIEQGEAIRIAADRVIENYSY